MKYLLILLVAATAALISVTATIPDYIKVCKRSDSRLNECILSSIQDLQSHLIQGIDELEVPKIDPLYLDKVDMELGRGLKAQVKDVKLKGLRDFNFDSVVVDLDKDIYSFNISIPEVAITGSYNIDGSLGSIPLRGKGPLTFEPKFVTGQGTLFGKKVSRGGKTYYYFTKMELKLSINDYHIRLENLFEGEPTLGEVTNKLLNEEKAEILPSLLPGIERAVTEKVLLIANNICKHFTWDELFPES